jgi:hypothetical protein
MVTEECVAPWLGYGWCREESEVVGVLIENFGAIYRVAQETFCETAAEHFLIAFWRERGFQDCMDGGLDVHSSKTKTPYYVDYKYKPVVQFCCRQTWIYI